MSQTYKLWEDSDIMIEHFAPSHKATTTAVIIFPGGGYSGHAVYEGEGYAQLFNTFGISAFVVNYRVKPHTFPLPLLDARRAIRFVRFNAEKFGISKDKVLVIGSSAGGHLAALVSTYKETICGEGVDETDNESCIPNGQILCYPVVTSDEGIIHQGSYKNLLGEGNLHMSDSVSPDKLADGDTPPAFIWHTADDQIVNVTNSYRYAEALAKHKVPHELHVFPHGPHGQALGAFIPYVAEWTNLLRRWLTLEGFAK